MNTLFLLILLSAVVSGCGLAPAQSTAPRSAAFASQSMSESSGRAQTDALAQVTSALAPTASAVISAMVTTTPTVAAHQTPTPAPTLAAPAVLSKFKLFDLPGAGRSPPPL